MVIAAPVLVGFVAIIVAMAAFMAYQAVRPLLGPLFEAIRDGVPLVGPTIYAIFEMYVEGTERLARGLADAAVTPLARLIAAIPDQATQLGDIAIALLTAIVHLARGATGAAVDASLGIMNGLIAAALAPVWGMINFINDVRIPNAEWFTQAVQAELWGALNERTAALYANIAATAGSIEFEWRNAVAGLSGALEAVDTAWRDAVRGIEAGIATQIGALGASIEARVMPLIDALARELAALRSAVVDAIPGLESRITSAEAATAAVAATAAAEAVAIRKWIHECGEPLCTHFSPEITLLDSLDELIALGLIGGLLADAISDPEGAARRIDGMIAGPLSSAIGSISSMGAGS